MSLHSKLTFPAAPVYLMDGSAFVYRAFYAYRNMARSDGFPTNVIFIVARILLKILREERPAYFSFILDGKGKTHRNDLYALYKANRSVTPEDLIKQLEPLLTLIRFLGIPCVVSQGCEADDCIASLAARIEQERPVVIVGADKDLKQCLTERVVLWDPGSKDEKLTTLQTFREETGMEPSSWPDYQALVGDSSDNIPGIPKIGPKTAEVLIKEFPTLEELFSRLPAVPPKVRVKLEGQRENALLYRELTRLQINACAHVELSDLSVNFVALADTISFMEQYELRSLIKEVESMHRAGIWDKTGASGVTATSHASSVSGQGGIAKRSVPSGFDKKVEQEHSTALVKESKSATAFLTADSQLRVQQTTLLEPTDDVDFAPLQNITSVALGESIAFIPLAQGLLLAGNGFEGIFLQTGSELVKVLESRKNVLITPDVKALCNMYPELWSLPVERWYDLSLSAYLLSPEDRAYSWKNLITRYGEQASVTYSPVEHPGLFSLELYAFFKDRLKGAELERVFLQLEMPLVPVLAAMEHRGITIDKEALASFLNEVKADLARLTASIHTMAGGEFNIRSSQQLADILFERLGLPRSGKTKGGASSTSQMTLEKLMGKHPIIDAMLEYRKLEKMRSTYLEPLPDQADENGRVHTTFNQTATATGRLSSSNPNLQNIPVRGPMGGRMRSCFIAAPDKKLVGADYSQIELRVLAHLSQDPNLLDAFRNNEDIHRRTAALLFDVAPDEVTPELRRNAKTINFGLIYGMGAQKLAQELGITMKEAKEFIERYFERLSQLKVFYDTIEEDAKKFGYVTTMAGRRRMTPDILSSNNQMRSQARRQAINTRIQGSAADIIKLAMIAVEDDNVLKELGATLLLQIHDELLMEVPPQNAEAAGKRLAQLMQRVKPGGEELRVPLLVEWGTGENWGETH